MAYITKHGTTVLAPRAVLAAIHAPAEAMEYFVTKRFSLRGEILAEEGDTIMAYPTERWPDRAFVTNLTFGNFGIIAYEDFCHNVRPKELVLS